MTKIDTFDEQYRLKVTRDECNDRVIQGRRGQRYFDGPELCLMVLDGKPANRSKWKALRLPACGGRGSPPAPRRRSAHRGSDA
jgi:hypothetical protein